jgi:hypothetical protein
VFLLFQLQLQPKLRLVEVELLCVVFVVVLTVVGFCVLVVDLCVVVVLSVDLTVVVVFGIDKRSENNMAAIIAVPIVLFVIILIALVVIFIIRVRRLNNSNIPHV